MNNRVDPTDAIAKVFITEQLHSRVPLVTNYRQESLALQDLADSMTDRPGEILSRLVKLAMEICGAESSGISILEGSQFRWFALSGILSAFEGATTPRDFSPCGITLDQNTAVLMEHPERAYEWIRDFNIAVPEVLLVPLVVKHADPIGTLWVVSNKTGHFNSGHAQVMTELAAFAGAALRMVKSEERAREALQQQETLTKEMSHRLKNLFAITDAMIRLTARSSSSKEEMAQRLSGRVQALASANALVRRSFAEGQGEGVNLSEIIQRILRPYNHVMNGVEGAEISVSPTMTNDLALVFHELATNAAKYGSLSQDGSVAVSWTFDETTLSVKWAETGGPVTTRPSRTGFGSLLVSNTIASHGGSIDYDWREQGLVVTISLPLHTLENVPRQA